MLENTERPGIEESYQGAIGTSDLTVGGGMVPKDRATGSGDVIAAGGMAGAFVEGDPAKVYAARRVGMALIRLRGEWESAAKPRRMGRQQLEAVVAHIRAQDAKDKESAKARRVPYASPGPAQARAQAEADKWYANELRLLAIGLKSRPTVWLEISHWMRDKKVEPATIAAALHYWLDSTCPKCDGHGLKRVPGQPALSARQCLECDGGQRRRPEGVGAALNYLDDCVQKARTAIKKRLHS